MDATTKHILVPVDFSDKAVYGLQLAANLLENSGGKVTVLNVLKGVDPVWSDFFSDDERVSFLDKLKKHLQNFTSKYIDLEKFDVTCIVEKGTLCDTILSKSEELGVSSIVMGTSTADNIKKRVIGTNALRVVSEAKCPVITLKQEPKNKKIKRIILPLDITKETREKVIDAVQLAKDLDAEILLVSAYTINDELIQRKLKAQQKQIVDFIQKYNIKVTASILQVDNKVDDVLDYINKNDGDIILITTHQQLEIVNMFLGSFAQSIIKYANIPVMSIVPKIKHSVVFHFPGS